MYPEHHYSSSWPLRRGHLICQRHSCRLKTGVLEVLDRGVGQYQFDGRLVAFRLERGGLGAQEVVVVLGRPLTTDSEVEKLRRLKRASRSRSARYAVNASRFLAESRCVMKRTLSRRACCQRAFSGTGSVVRAVEVQSCTMVRVTSASLYYVWVETSI